LLQYNSLLSHAYLLDYNIMYILPLVVILVAAASRRGLNNLMRWNLRHRETVKLMLGGSVVVLGLAIPATA
jgi:cytochrome c biogenesis protein CcdA